MYAALFLLIWFAAFAVAEACLARGAAIARGGGDGRLATNFGLTALILFGSAIMPLVGLGVLARGPQGGGGLMAVLGLGTVAIFLLTLLARTFVAYWVHRLVHAIPLLWRIHRVHHADDHVDISTSLRNHPLELLFAAPSATLVLLALGTPIALVVAVDTILFAAAIWQHADIPLPGRLERGLGAIFVTPGIHRLHHAPDRVLHDSNFGDILTVWDRLFGTFNPVSACAERVGLDGEAVRSDSFWGQLCAPFTSSPSPPGRAKPSRRRWDEINERSERQV
ncbi:MAG: sterol desaturase family protein [Sphingomicrobium sp.]|nr:sterol desaturase family protein [Sphingomonadales bacterium]